MAQYEYDISKNSDFQALLQYFDDIEKAFTSKKFFEYLADKCMKELDRIMSENLVGYDEHSVFYGKLDEYKNNNKLTFTDNGFIISNDTNMEQSEMWWVSPKTRDNYPDGISIAYIVEYGTGLKGTSQDDWQVNVHNYGSNGWRFVDPDTGFLKVSTGSEGRFIYQKLRDRIEEMASIWIYYYFEREVK